MRNFQEEVENNFSYHKVSPAVAFEMAALRAKFKALALEILRVCPETRDRQIGITHLEQALMWTIASLARQEPVGPFTNLVEQTIQAEEDLGEAKKLLRECMTQLQTSEESESAELVKRIWKLL